MYISTNHIKYVNLWNGSKTIDGREKNSHRVNLCHCWCVNSTRSRPLEGNIFVYSGFKKQRYEKRMMTVGMWKERWEGKYAALPASKEHTGRLQYCGILPIPSDQQSSMPGQEKDLKKFTRTYKHRGIQLVAFENTHTPEYLWLPHMKNAAIR